MSPPDPPQLHAWDGNNPQNHKCEDIRHSTLLLHGGGTKELLGEHMRMAEKEQHRAKPEPITRVFCVYRMPTNQRRIVKVAQGGVGGVVTLQALSSDEKNSIYVFAFCCFIPRNRVNSLQIVASSLRKHDA